MSVENGKVCCNCRHNIRKWDEYDCYCWCEVKNEKMGYTRVMTDWCRHWSKDKEIKNEP